MTDRACSDCDRPTPAADLCGAVCYRCRAARIAPRVGRAGNPFVWSVADDGRPEGGMSLDRVAVRRGSLIFGLLVEPLEAHVRAARNNAALAFGGAVR